MQGVFHVKQQERRFGSVSRETLFSAETGRGSFSCRNEVQPEIIIFFLWTRSRVQLREAYCCICCKAANSCRQPRSLRKVGVAA